MDNLLTMVQALYMDGHTLHDVKQCYRNYDRMCLVNTAMLLRREKHKFTVPKKLKNNRRSEELRLCGNNLFKLNKLFGALECYNKTICFATKTSEHLAIGYANRSAVYLELKEYQFCLENISLAKSTGHYPARLMDKLNRREIDCLKLMETVGGASNGHHKLEKEEPKLSLNAHPQIPFIADCLQMKTNVIEGRHIITTDDLRPGQIVAIEDAFVHVIYENLNYRRCTNCTKDNMLNLIPCEFCTNSMFCSQKCMDEAAKDFHEFECPITDFLTAHQNTRFVLRLVIRAVKSFQTDTEMFDFIEDADTSKVTTFSFDHTKELSAKERYHQVHSLTTHETEQSDMHLLFRSIYSMLLFEQLLQHTKMKDLMSFRDCEVSRVALAELIFHSFLIVPQNGHILSSFDAKETENIGGAIYPFSSLVNHACSPNVFRISCGTKNVFVVLRPIKKGEQLLDCYTKDYNSKLVTKIERRENLKDCLHFDCKCVACRKSFPLKIHYKRANIPIIQCGKDAKENISKCATYLTSYDNKYPCVEVDLIQEILTKSMNELYGNVSAKCNFKTMG